MATGSGPDSNPTAKALGEAIVEIRKEKDITQSALAEKAGLHVTYVSHIENGIRNPGFANVTRLAEALGIKASELVARAEQLDK